MTVLRKGSKGPEVKTLQQKLNLIDDGIFGPITEEAVKAFQLANNIICDGIVGQSTWNKLLNNSSRKITEIILHCAATPEGKDFTVDLIRKWHLLRGFSDIGYHYVIYRDGSVHTGRDINKVGAHCTNHNSNSIGICYIGGCDTLGKNAKDTRTPALKLALVKLVKELMTKYNIPKTKIFGHYQLTVPVGAKACPSFDVPAFIKKEL